MAQDAAVPLSTIKELIQREVEAGISRYARSGPLRNASITGGAGLSIRDGGSLTVSDGGGVAVVGDGGITIDGGHLSVRGLPGAQPGATGDSTVYLGGITPTMPDGTLQPGLIVRREDGTIALALYDPTPDPDVDDGFNQFLAWWDRAEVIVVADDTVSGQGLSRPYVPIPLTRARFADMVAVTSDASVAPGGGWVDVFATPGVFHKVNARARAHLRCTTDAPGTAGEVRVLVDGVQVGDVQQVGFVVETKYVGPFVVPGDAYTTHSITVQARRTAGTGAVRLDAAVWGVQS